MVETWPSVSTTLARWELRRRVVSSIYRQLVFRCSIIMRMRTLGRLLARRVLREGLPHGTFLNLNVPKLPHVKGIKVCRQADGRWVREYKRSENASGESVFWLTGDFESAKPIHPENDMLALDCGYASLVPCKVDVTDYDFMNTLREWQL